MEIMQTVLFPFSDAKPKDFRSAKQGFFKLSPLAIQGLHRKSGFPPNFPFPGKLGFPYFLAVLAEKSTWSFDKCVSEGYAKTQPGFDRIVLAVEKSIGSKSIKFTQVFSFSKLLGFILIKKETSTCSFSLISNTYSNAYIEIENDRPHDRFLIEIQRKISNFLFMRFEWLNCI